MKRATAELTFWGVRGSMASAGAGTKCFGGESPCVEICWRETRIICDAGTGIRRLGMKLEKEGKKIRAALLFSHLHLDHIIGLPFFRPLYSAKNSFVLAGPKNGGEEFRAALARCVSPPYFPLPIRAAPAKLTYRTVDAKPFTVDDVRVLPFHLRHPGGALGWRLEFPHGKAIVHVSDNEPGERAWQKKMVKWLTGADLLVHDAQYTPTEYRQKHGWGHSPYTFPLKLAALAGIKRVILFHHDPDHDDQRLRSFLAEARRYVKQQKWKLTCELAMEGQSLTI